MSLSVFQFIQIISINALSTLLYTRVAPQNPFLEFLFYSIPQYCVFMYLEYSYLVFGIVVGWLILSFIVDRRQCDDQCDVHCDVHCDDRGQCIDVNNNSNCIHVNNNNHYTVNSIDRIRMLIIFLVASTIYSADFPNYNSLKLGKSMDTSFRLMDIGVGSFAFNSGLVSSRKKGSAILKCFLFGAIRSISIYLLGLKVCEGEFGRHLNFFYGLGILNLISMLCVPSRPFVLGLAIVVFHQALLWVGLEKLIFNNTRSTVITANLEGISFILPQMGIHWMARGVNGILCDGLIDGGSKCDGLIDGNSNNQCDSANHSIIQHKRNIKLIRLLTYLFITLPIFLISIQYTPIIRRLHNASYCLLIFTSHLGMIILYEYIEIIFGPPQLRITKFASRNILFVLIFSNLMIPISKAVGIFVLTGVGRDIAVQGYLGLVFLIMSRIIN